MERKKNFEREIFRYCFASQQRRRYFITFSSHVIQVWTLKVKVNAAVAVNSFSVAQKVKKIFRISDCSSKKKLNDRGECGKVFLTVLNGLLFDFSFLPLGVTRILGQSNMQRKLRVKWARSCTCRRSQLCDKNSLFTYYVLITRVMGGTWTCHHYFFCFLRGYANISHVTQ